MPKRKIKPGAIIKIRIDEEYHTYGRILQEYPNIAVYDCRTKEDSDDMNQIISRSILFVIKVHDFVIREGRWTEIGNVPIAQGEIQIPKRYRQNKGNLEKCIIVDADGTERAATIEECVGLDIGAGWLPEHVEERLRDHYAGRRNIWLEGDKVRRPGHYKGIQQFSRGDVIKIPFAKEYHTYGRIWGPFEQHISSDRLSNVVAAVYDCRMTNDTGDVTEIISKPMLFVVVVYGETVLERKWAKVGRIPIANDEDLKACAVFIQDIFNPVECTILEGPVSRRATPKQCEGLERMAIWEAGEVEERIRDHYAGRQNRMLEYWRLRKPLSKEEPRKSDLDRKRSEPEAKKNKKRKRKPTKLLDDYEYEELKKFELCMWEFDRNEYGDLLKSSGIDISSEIHPLNVLERFERENLSRAKESVILGIQARLITFRDLDKNEIKKYDAYLEGKGALTFSELGHAVFSQISEILDRGTIENENEIHLIRELVDYYEGSEFREEEYEQALRLIENYI